MLSSLVLLVTTNNQENQDKTDDGDYRAKAENMRIKMTNDEDDDDHSDHDDDRILRRTVLLG